MRYDRRDRYDDRDGRYRDDEYRDRDSDYCRRGRFRRPRIEIHKVKQSGGFFSGKYRISGSVQGACIEEAGYYESGRLKERFEIPMTDSFKRHEFQIRVKSGKRGEIRVYAADGSEDIIEVDQELSQQKSAF